MRRDKKIILIVSTAIAFFSAVFIFISKSPTVKRELGLSQRRDSFPKEETRLRIEDKGPGFAMLWWTDFNNNRVIGFTPGGKVPWAQNMSAAPIPRESWYFIGGIENVTVAPNGNLITVHGDGMMVQEIDRQSHNLVWQYGAAGIQTYRGGTLDEPDKSYKINDHEVAINDGNDRQVKIVDQNTNQVTWEYGQYHAMSSAPGFLRGNTSIRPIDGGKQILITDTTSKKIILVDRATKNIVWEYSKPDAEWLQNVSVDPEGNFVLEDRLKGEVFAINRAGQIIWKLTKLSDANSIIYPTDTAVLANGNVLIAESGRHRIVEVMPATGEVVRQYLIHGFVSSIAIDQDDLAGKTYVPQKSADPNIPTTVTVEDYGRVMTSDGAAASGNTTISGKVSDTNPSTGKAGSISLKEGYGIQVYNYTHLTGKNGAPLSLKSVQKGDRITATGSLSGTYLRATSVQDESR